MTLVGTIYIYIPLFVVQCIVHLQRYYLYFDLFDFDGLLFFIRMLFLDCCYLQLRVLDKIFLFSKMFESFPNLVRLNLLFVCLFVCFCL